MIRFYNANILKPDMTVEFGEVWIKGNEIAYVGESKPAEEAFETTINLNGNLIMPAFKNSHTHSAMTFLRSFADDLPLQEWLFNKIFPMEAKLTEEDVYILTKLAFAEYLTSGISACFDMYFYPESVAKAAVDTGFRTIMCGSVSGNDTKEDVDSALTRLEKFYTDYNNYNSDLVSYRLGFHAEYTTSRSIMEGIAALAEKYKAPVSTHNSETASEVLDCIGRYGCTPTELFADLGLLKYGGAGFHCVHMTENDLKILVETGCYAVTNTCSNAKLASGTARIADMVQTGVKLAIGTDGPSSNNALDFFREMYLACVLQKLLKNDAAAMPAETVLKAAFDGGAMGLFNASEISVGSKADLTVIDLNQPNMQPLNSIVKNVVYSGSKQNVALTMVNGKILYRDGAFTTLDTAELYDKSNAIIKRMTAEK
jgi:5-methylthioadenosine/S-adenosylhomocysteine deaminase